uniref:Uncharacterized protein n=1 Tax=uncultured marine group II/III euryarchaeote AD1000_57_F12 TaxID=1457788 RepID=A0A075FZT7_9EURY|nr:hypothetical protein [uncultured marine group II/III euryarchaeote AD1000_57_F12]
MIGAIMDLDNKLKNLLTSVTQVCASIQVSLSRKDDGIEYDKGKYLYDNNANHINSWATIITMIRKKLFREIHNHNCIRFGTEGPVWHNDLVQQLANPDGTKWQKYYHRNSVYFNEQKRLLDSVKNIVDEELGDRFASELMDSGEDRNDFLYHFCHTSDRFAVHNLSNINHQDDDIEDIDALEADIINALSRDDLSYLIQRASRAAARGYVISAIIEEEEGNFVEQLNNFEKKLHAAVWNKGNRADDIQRRLENMRWGPLQFVGEEPTRIDPVKTKLSNNSIISLIGLGGVGKTALAHKIMHDCITGEIEDKSEKEILNFDYYLPITSKIDKQGEIDEHGEKVGFSEETSIFTSFRSSEGRIKGSVKRIFQDIIHLLHPNENLEREDLGDLRPRAEKILTDNKILLVIDNFEDIEDEQNDEDVIKERENFENFFSSFGNLRGGSKIIITTRGTGGYASTKHTVPRLTESESYDLFEKKVRERAGAGDIPQDYVIKVKGYQSRISETFSLWQYQRQEGGEATQESGAHPMLVICAAAELDTDCLDLDVDCPEEKCKGKIGNPCTTQEIIEGNEESSRRFVNDQPLEEHHKSRVLLKKSDGSKKATIDRIVELLQRWKEGNDKKDNIIEYCVSQTFGGMPNDQRKLTLCLSTVPIDKKITNQFIVDMWIHFREEQPNLRDANTYLRFMNDREFLSHVSRGEYMWGPGVQDQLLNRWSKEKDQFDIPHYKQLDSEHFAALPQQEMVVEETGNDSTINKEVRTELKKWLAANDPKDVVKVGMTKGTTKPRKSTKQVFDQPRPKEDAKDAGKTNIEIWFRELKEEEPATGTFQGDRTDKEMRDILNLLYGLDSPTENQNLISMIHFNPNSPLAKRHKEDVLELLKKWKECLFNRLVELKCYSGALKFCMQIAKSVELLFGMGGQVIGDIDDSYRLLRGVDRQLIDINDWNDCCATLLLQSAEAINPSNVSTVKELDLSFGTNAVYNQSEIEKIYQKWYEFWKYSGVEESLRGQRSDLLRQQVFWISLRLAATTSSEHELSDEFIDICDNNLVHGQNFGSKRGISIGRVEIYLSQVKKVHKTLAMSTKEVLNAFKFSGLLKRGFYILASFSFDSNRQIMRNISHREDVNIIIKGEYLDINVDEEIVTTIHNIDRDSKTIEVYPVRNEDKTLANISDLAETKWQKFSQDVQRAINQLRVDEKEKYSFNSIFSKLSEMSGHDVQVILSGGKSFKDRQEEVAIRLIEMDNTDDETLKLKYERMRSSLIFYFGELVSIGQEGQWKYQSISGASIIYNRYLLLPENPMEMADMINAFYKIKREGHHVSYSDVHLELKRTVLISDKDESEKNDRIFRFVKERCRRMDFKRDFLDIIPWDNYPDSEEEFIDKFHHALIRHTQRQPNSDNRYMEGIITSYFEEVKESI